MARHQDPRPLPSKVIFPDGVASLDALSREDRAKVQAQICSSINRQLAAHYASRQKEWSVFLTALEKSE